MCVGRNHLRYDVIATLCGQSSKWGDGDVPDTEAVKNYSERSLADSKSVLDAPSWRKGFGGVAHCNVIH